MTDPVSSGAPLRLFNSLTRKLETFEPIHAGEARVYSCGPTVYNYQHIGNLRAYVFADTLGRALTWKGFQLSHVVNVTDVGHLTSDADLGDDKMEKAAAQQGKSAWEIARYYQDVWERDLGWLNVRKPAHPRATEYIQEMIAWAESIAPKHCYELDTGLYFDVSTVPDYGRLARAANDVDELGGEGRIEPVAGKRHSADFAIWRRTPAGETRQMEWDSPWGRGAPGWHIECSVMSSELLGHPFDIHTGGIDHREIHHPNEIAQNQAHGCTPDTGARIWMHNNFLIDRRGKMSKSTGEFLVLQTLADKGYHPLACRLMCLQAHYRSEIEFSWEGLHAALVRLKRINLGVRQQAEIYHREHALPASSLTAGEGAPPPLVPPPQGRADTLRRALANPRLLELLDKFETALAEDLNTPVALTVFEEVLAAKKVPAGEKALLALGLLFPLGLRVLEREELRVRPVGAEISEDDIASALARRQAARADKDFATSDAIREDLAAKGVEVMDGDPLGWEWKLG
jgi:cysteinyl-tRNA synthetase